MTPPILGGVIFSRHTGGGRRHIIRAAVLPSVLISSKNDMMVYVHLQLHTLFFKKYILKIGNVGTRHKAYRYMH